MHTVGLQRVWHHARVVLGEPRESQNADASTQSLHEPQSLSSPDDDDEELEDAEDRAIRGAGADAVASDCLDLKHRLHAFQSLEGEVVRSA